MTTWSVFQNQVAFTDFASKAFISTVERYFILYSDVYTMIPECLSKILGVMWEELTTQVINLSQFCVFVMYLNPL